MLVRELRSFIVIPDVTRFCVNPDGGSYSRPRDRFIVIPDVMKFESILTGSYSRPRDRFSRHSGREVIVIPDG